MWRIREAGDAVDVNVILVTVYPEEGNFPDMARALLEAADDPGQVRYVSHPQAGFIVPVEVLERFEASRGQDEGTGEQAQAPKRRGRPRKTADASAPVAGTDPGKEE